MPPLNVGNIKCNKLDYTCMYMPGTWKAFSKGLLLKKKKKVSSLVLRDPK